jgi:parvulin-like peptidyl-prolyl isomerase
MTYLRSFGLLLACLTPTMLLAQSAPLPATGQPTQPMQPAQPGIRPAQAPNYDPNAIAATVDGAPIYEKAVQMLLERVLPANRAEVRPDVINFLIDNLLVDQYLIKNGLNPTPQEVDAAINEFKIELAKENKDFATEIKKQGLTEAEVRQHLTSDLRLEKFVTSQATDGALKQLFDGNKEMFDGSGVRARHILVTPPENDPKAVEAAIAALRTYKQHIETQGAAAVARLPGNADAATREKIRIQAIEETFALVARDRSACPTKERGGDLGWFRRAGYMAEPLAKAAFALKPYEMSDVVKSRIGYHLILVTERKPGEDVKFEDPRVKERVKFFFYDRLRENLIGQLRPRARITIAHGS